MAPLDLDILRSFVAIVELGGFTRAAERLGRTQSTISLQIKRLEETLGKRLLDRNSRQIALTTEGERLLGYARRILQLTEEAREAVSEPEVEGVVRLGTPEDFATHRLPRVLADFARGHPRVALEVHCQLTVLLNEGFERGDYDLVLVKRDLEGPSAGERVWREPLVWTGGAGFDYGSAESGSPLPLVLSPQPCVYRKRALSALDANGRPWRIAYTSTSLAGTLAVVEAGLGVTVLPKDMVSSGLRVLDGEGGLPNLADTEIALLRASSLSPAAQRLADHIVQALEVPR
ncbi:LysR substrate-binding domain-containing protein [Algihabitans albus]|uniref:LysR substrate-binding domain-containing protein n=1 Tax=Algihabitans albus TaxID=2164067 RepID=UPI000E5C7319|nr:LysR substrate-binding domain-containing protein [Algihabitans albus]